VVNLSDPETSVQSPRARGGQFPYRFGLALPTCGPFSQPSTIFDFADVAERLGFDDVWVNDHLTFDWDQRVVAPVGTIDAIKDEEPNFLESMTTAAALLGRTRRIGVAIGGLVLPLRDPRWFAKQVTSLHELTGRRLTLGPGIGMIPRSFEIMQIPYERRGQLFDEYLAVLHALCFTEPPVSFAGPTIKFERANFYPRATGLRLLIAGEGQRALERTVKWGHGWLTSYPELSVYAARVRTLRELAAARGRDPDEIDTAVLVFICVADTRERALEISGPSLAARLGSLEHAQNVSILGPATEAVDRLVALHRAGVRYVHLRPVTQDPAAWVEMVHQISADVLPAVRAATDGRTG
jgi:alkanesulfonate monooxygenase SsuD/methylene tetrahydromethanopterin reductase-like flavin-dependent oxidoreductase (luciferase family)